MCRPDDDESLLSLLERIVEKARLIADMMWQLQSKIKDTNLRNIDNNSKHKKLTQFDIDAEEEEEEKGGSPQQMRQKRNRTNSISGNSIANTLGKSSISKNLFANISAAIGVEDNGENRKYRTEAKLRGMSDVDDTNIKQLQDNTSNMI